MNTDTLFDKAIERLSFYPVFEHESVEYQVVVLLKKSPPLEAYWWSGKQVHILAVDVNGNFFLRHCDGGVRYWSHTSKSEIIVSSSVANFLGSLREDTNGTFEYRGKGG